MGQKHILNENSTTWQTWLAVPSLLSSFCNWRDISLSAFAASVNVFLTFFTSSFCSSKFNFNSSIRSAFCFARFNSLVESASITRAWSTSESWSAPGWAWKQKEICRNQQQRNPCDSANLQVLQNEENFSTRVRKYQLLKGNSVPRGLLAKCI